MIMTGKVNRTATFRWEDESLQFSKFCIQNIWFFIEASDSLTNKTCQLSKVPPTEERVKITNLFFSKLRKMENAFNERPTD